MTDVIIVGAGSAGCVLANRLSAAGAEVLLLEAGADTPPGQVPADIDDLYPRSYYNGAYMWPGLAADQGADGTGTKTPFPQARVVGGGSSVMGMIALRGQPDDYDAWHAGGADGWSWHDVLPYFCRLESDRDFGGPLHGSAGPVTIRRHFFEDWPPFCAAVAHACTDKGIDVVEDMNADFTDGYCPLPISATLTRRVSVASAYLDAATRRRPGLTIRCGTLVERLVFEGSRCVGVSATVGGRSVVHRATHTIVSAGAIHSPALLMRSGIGDGGALTRLQIPVVVDLPGVGANLQNHPVVYLAAHVKPEARQSPSLRPQFISALRFSSGQSPTMRGDLLMLVINKSSWHGVGQAVAGLGVMLMRSLTRGAVTLTSADPHEPADVRFRMLSDDRDLACMVDGLALAVGLMQSDSVRETRHELFTAGYSRVVRGLNQPRLRNVIASRLLARLLDGPDRLRRSIINWGIAGREIDEHRMRERAWQLSAVRRRTFGTYHPAGTCKMGAACDPEAVVSSSCGVYGVSGLSVVDASIMPSLPRANTNLPVIMLAERAAERAVAADFDA